MPARSTKTIQGIITVVQETRFRLMTDAGQGLLLTLAHNANADGNDLRRLLDTRAYVSVSYTGEPNLANGVAHKVIRSKDPRVRS